MLGDTSGTFAAFPGQPTPMTDHAGMTVPLVQQPSVGAQPMSLAVPQYNNPESGGTAQQAPPRTAPFSVLLCSLSEDALETLPPTPPVECVQREVCGDAATRPSWLPLIRTMHPVSDSSMPSRSPQ